MSPAVAAPHPRTLLGAARAMLQPASEAQDLHLQAQAACLLGDYPRARQLWAALAQEGDGEALAQLVQLVQLAQREAGALTEFSGFSGPRCPR